MKTGQPLTEIAAELERQIHTRKDYLIQQNALDARVTVVDEREALILEGLNGTPMNVTPHAHGQFASHLDIPKKYYDRMLAEQPELLARNLNTWLHANGKERRMVRTLDGAARAFLSPKYRPLDNYDLAGAVLPKLQTLGVQVTSAALTPTRMYIKGILPTLSEEPPAGGTWGQGHVITDKPRLVAALVISNSEVGAGRLLVEPSVFDTRCTNLGIISAQAAMQKYHVGRSFDASENLELYRDDTRIADDKAFWLKVRDVVDAAFSEDIFRAAIAQIRDAAGRPIVSENLPRVVDVTIKRLALPESTAPSILTFLARGGDLSQWGLASALTSTANGFDDYEGATELERAGGKVLALAPADWEAIATAA